MHVTVQITGDINEVAKVLLSATRVGLKVDEGALAPVTAAEVVEKPPRTRRTRAEIEAAKAAEAAPPPAESAPNSPPPPAAIPTDAEVQAALVAVNDKHGIEKALEVLGAFGVKRGRELKDEQKRPFLAHCQSLL